MININKKVKTKSAVNPAHTKISLKSADEQDDFAEKIFNTVREPLILLDKEFNVVNASRSFYNFFKVTSNETLGRLFYDLGNHQWNIPKLRELLEKILSQNITFEKFEVEHNFTSIGKRVLLLDARQIERGPGKEKIILLAIEDITENKLAEEELQKSNKKYLGIFENIQDVYFETSIDGTLLEISPSISNVLKGKYRRDDLIGKSMNDLYSDANERKVFLSALQQQGNVADYQITLKNSGGLLIPCSIYAKILFDDKGNPKKIVGSLRDITKRKSAEEALEHERNLFQTLLDNVPDLIYFKDADGRYLLNNRNHLLSLGNKNQEEVIGKTSFDFDPHELAQQYYNDEMHVVQSGKPLFDKEELALRRDTGEQRWHLTSKIPLIDKDGNVKGIVGISRDITKSKRAEEELQKSDNKLKEAMKIAKLGTWDYDVFLDQFTFNDQFYTLFNTTVEREGGYNMSSSHYTQKFVQPDDMSMVGAEIQKSLETTDPNYFVHIDHRIIRADGGVGYITVFIRSEKDVNGRTVKTHGVNQDITERKRAEKEIEEINRHLGELNKTKDKLFSIIAHDLRNPFITILGFCEILQTEFVQLTEDEKLSYITEMKKSAEISYALLQNLLQWSRSQTGHIEFAPQKIDLLKIIKDNIKLVKTSAERKEIDISYKIPESANIIIADEDMLNSIIRNLLTNALKFTMRSGKIEIAVVELQEFVKICVSDTGVGMNEEVRKNLFRLDATHSTVGTDNEAGTGLGLILCKEFVERHGGKIWAESELGKGSKFFFTLKSNFTKTSDSKPDTIM